MGLYQLIFPIYALCFSLSCAGIETALSRSVARCMAQRKKREADILLYQSLLFSVSGALLLAIILHMLSPILSSTLFNEVRCVFLLKTLAWALPFAAVHSCFCGYYLGQKHTLLPASSQLVEQVSRILSVFLVCHLSKSFSVWTAVLGLVVGECISACYCAYYFFVKPHTRFSILGVRNAKHLRKELLGLSIPLTSNRVIMNLLQSVETISIPVFLQTYGYNVSDALRTYGVFTGMAMPCIFFPTAVTSSVSTMLLPTVAEIEAENKLTRLKQLIRKVIFFGFGLGSLCGIFFLTSASYIGNLLFHSVQAGKFLQTLAWICPFLYMNQTLISILNGLGKAGKAFFINISGLIVRIAGAWYGITHFGMTGYLIGLLISQILVSILCISQLGTYIEHRELY